MEVLERARRLHTVVDVVRNAFFAQQVVFEPGIAAALGRGNDPLRKGRNENRCSRCEQEGRSRQDAWLSDRETAPVKAARVAEDHGAARSGEGAHLIGRNAPGNLIFRDSAVVHWPPGAYVVEASARLTARDVLERSGVLVDIRQVEERLEQVTIVEVEVPGLRGDSLGIRRLRDRVPQVDVRKLRPQP